MPTLVTTIEKLNICPDVTVDNTTSYPADTSHDISNFKDYAKLDVILPNDMPKSFEAMYPADGTESSFESCLVGKYTATFTALPTPPNAPISGQATVYQNGENFYWNGNIYEVTTLVIQIPAVGLPNSDLIPASVIAGFLKIIEKEEINSKYKATISFTHWCSLDKCLKDKLAKVNCEIVAEPTRNDICEMKEYEEALQLNFIKNEVDEILLNPYVQSEVEDAKIKKLSNYVNSICCSCQKCKEC